MTSKQPKAVGLFAGIGGIELGLEAAGFETALLCEVDEGAQAVLAARFSDAKIVGDISEVSSLRACEVVSAGFPCTDLSQAGRTAGIRGDASGLVAHVFRLLDGCDKPPKWLVLENVPNMLRLDRGAAMQYLTEELSDRGMKWAYRIVDARAFGIPQRRRRVLLVASATEDPRPVLFGQDAGEPPIVTGHDGRACGFYWTEGNRGLGWGVDCVPTLKGGSGWGIPSPPAIWMPDGSIVTPDIRDAERLQGFEADWTEPAVSAAGTRAGARWKMVGNAVCVPMAEWLGGRLSKPTIDRPWFVETPLEAGSKWPDAAWGEHDKAWSVELSAYPINTPPPPLADFLRFDGKPLSHRATAGFRSRLAASTLRHPPEFMRDLERHEAATA